MVTPASRQRLTSRLASATPVFPQAENKSPLPPKVPVPNVNTGTLKPEPPRNRYSINRASVDAKPELSNFGRLIGAIKTVGHQRPDPHPTAARSHPPHQ